MAMAMFLVVFLSAGAAASSTPLECHSATAGLQPPYINRITAPQHAKVPLGGATIPSATEMGQIKARFTAQVTDPTTAAAAAEYASTIRPDGSWSDIDYKDKTRGGWKTEVHMARVSWFEGGLVVSPCPLRVDHHHHQLPSTRHAVSGSPPQSPRGCARPSAV
jgi:hypothetical protein